MGSINEKKGQKSRDTAPLKCEILELGSFNNLAQYNMASVKNHSTLLCSIVLVYCLPVSGELYWNYGKCGAGGTGSSKLIS